MMLKFQNVLRRIKTYCLIMMVSLCSMSVLAASSFSSDVALIELDEGEYFSDQKNANNAIKNEKAGSRKRNLKGIEKFPVEEYHSSSAIDYALVIGINDYENYPQLNTAINDAKAIAVRLQNQYGFRVALLKNVNRQTLINTLANYRNILNKHDRMLIYFAGHGVLDKQADEGYWLPVDAQQGDYANLISNSTITSLIKSMPAHHVLLIADSCFSGKLTRGIQLHYNDAEYDRISLSRSRSVITSGGLEPVEDGTGKHSIFAKFLLTILKNNRHKIVTTELFYKLRRLVILNSDQTPEFADLRKAGHEGGEFVFSTKIIDPMSIKFNTSQAKLKGQPQHQYSVPTESEESVRPNKQSMNPQSGVFSDRLPSGSRGPEMIVLPQGQFTMGDIAGMGYENETPLHQVAINYQFALSRYEVTFAQYDNFARETRRSLPDSNGWGRDNRPVINVSWDDASAYAKWLSRKTGNQYRLPSEAEWEYAARAGSSSVYSWGNYIGKNKTNCSDCKADSDRLQTKTVGSYHENEFGLFDMHGNVREWTADCWNPAYNGAPYDGSAWRNGDCSQRVIRGGAWSLNNDYVRAAARSRASSNIVSERQGFRLAMSIVSYQ